MVSDSVVVIVHQPLTQVVVAPQPAPEVTVITGQQGPPGAQGPAGPAGAAAYIHTQSVAATVWTINHNRGSRPSVTLFSVGGVEFEAEIVHATVNQCLVYLSTPTAGSARLV